MKINKSFLKWAGGKCKVLPHLSPLINTPNTFCEPFAGSMVVSMNTISNNYIVNDINTDLINVYKTILEHGYSFIHECSLYFNSNLNTEQNFYELRNQFNSINDPIEKSKLFIYLNRHCFNGLTRYNQNGKYNVPYGKYKTNYFPEKEMKNFYDSMIKKNINIYNKSFDDEDLYINLGKNDVVYFDPPYIPISKTSNFTSYTNFIFGETNQIKLVEIAKTLATKGVKVLISNNNTEYSRHLYRDCVKMINISVSKTISANSNSRNKVEEIIAIYE